MRDILLENIFLEGCLLLLSWDLNWTYRREVFIEGLKIGHQTIEVKRSSYKESNIFAMYSQLQIT